MNWQKGVPREHPLPNPILISPKGIIQPERNMVKRKKFENIDILASLEAIMKQNTAYFQEDLECDRKIILERAGSSNTDDKTLLWLSRDTGTECLRERDVFIKGTVGHEIWCYYAESGCGHFLAYAVELHGIQDGRAIGNLYELDYAKHYGRVKSGAVSSQKTVLVYEHGIKDMPSVPYVDGDPDPKLGKFKRFESQPDGLEVLAALLLEEKRRRNKLEPGVLEDHITVLHDRMIWREACRVAREFKKIQKPNRPGDKGFQVELSHTFLPLASAADLERLRSVLSCPTLSFIHVNGQSGRVYVAISKDDKRSIRLPKRYK